MVMSLVEDAKSGIPLNAPNSSCTSILSGLYKSNAWHTEKQYLERFHAEPNSESEAYDTLKYIFIVSNHQSEVNPIFIVLMLKANNLDIAKKVTYALPDTKK